MMRNQNKLLNQIFTIPLSENKHLVYAPLKRTAFIANAGLVNMIFDRCLGKQTQVRRNDQQRIPPESAENVYGFLASLDRSGFFEPGSEPEDDHGKTGAMYDTAVLFPTNECNLRCIYCYAFAGEFRKQRMPWEIARAGIDFVFDSVVKNELPSFHLGFHGGGEPSLGEAVLKQACDYANDLCSRRDIRLSISGAFNGFMSDRMVRYIIGHFTEASVSFDGIPEVQNCQRPTREGRPSFHRVADCMHAMDETNFPYGIRMTVTGESVSRLEESICFICENFNPRAIHAEPVFHQGRARRNRLAMKDFDCFIAGFLRGTEHARARGIHLYYSGVRPDVITQRFCEAPRRALIVTPGGDITTCFEVFGREDSEKNGFVVGSYSGDGVFDINREKLSRHLTRTVSSIDFCEACFCKWHCAGDCAGKEFENAGDSLAATDRCDLNRQLTVHMILDRIKQSGGRIWSEHIGE